MSALPQPNHEGGKPSLFDKLSGFLGAGQPPQSEPVERPVGPESADAVSVPERPGDGVVIRYPDADEQLEILAEHETECRRLEAKIAAEEAEFRRNLPEIPAGPPPEPKPVYRSPAALASSPPVVPSRSAILQLAESRMYRPDSPPPEEEARLLINGVPICHPGNITTLTSAAKNMKSVCLGGAVSSLLGAPEGTDCLSWQSPAGEGVVIHLDTEQSPRQHWESMERVRARCGDSIQNLLSYLVTGWSPSAIRELLREVVSYWKDRPGGIRGIVVDGAADLVESPNDERECFELVRELMGLSVKAHAPLLTVVHLNPGDSKARGHLGSELERKSERVLELFDRKADATRLGKLKSLDGERVITLVTRRSRGAPLTVENAPSFAWNKEANMPMTVVPEDGKGSKHPNSDKALALEVITEMERLLPAEIKQRIANKRGVGQKLKFLSTTWPTLRIHTERRLC